MNIVKNVRNEQKFVVLKFIFTNVRKLKSLFGSIW